MRAFVPALALLAARVCAAEQFQYGVLVDAGSTGSRVHVYRWPTRAVDALPLPFTQPVTQESWTKKVNPGLSSFASHPDDVGPYLDQLVEFAKATIGDAAAAADVSFFLMATAGMRILPSAQRDGLLARVRVHLRACGFSFASDSQARVISGEEEGVYGWVTANYLAGTLEGPADRTIGALDLGGASTQVTFSPATDILSNLFWLHLSTALNRQLYTHSYLYFGINEAEDRIARALLGPAPTAGETRPSPCYNPGYTLNFTDGPIYGGRFYLLSGNGSFDACREEAKKLMGLDAPCFTEPEPDPSGHDACGLNGVYQPPLAGRTFFSFSTFAYLIDFLGAPANVSLASLADRGRDLCATNYGDLRRAHPKEDDDFLHRYCLYAAYAVALLQDGYRFPADAHSITFTNRVGGIDVSWALGAILFEANLLPAKLVRQSPDHTYKLAFWVAVPILLAALLVAGACICHLRKAHYHPVPTGPDGRVASYASL